MTLPLAFAAERAWLAIVRKGVHTRGLADELVAQFDLIDGDGREPWQRLIDRNRNIAGFEHLIAAAVERFDLVPPR